MIHTFGREREKNPRPLKGRNKNERGGINENTVKNGHSISKNSLNLIVEKWQVSASKCK